MLTGHITSLGVTRLGVYYSKIGQIQARLFTVTLFVYLVQV